MVRSQHSRSVPPNATCDAGGVLGGRASRVLLVAIGVALVAAVGGFLVRRADETSVGAGRPPEDLADLLGCTGVEPYGGYDAIDRGGASMNGITCTAGTVSVQIFERAPLGDGDTSDEPYASAEGGSVENINRLVGGGQVGPPGCLGWLLIGETWFLVADDEAFLERAAETLGGVEQAVQPAYTFLSYELPGCDEAR